MTTSDKMNYLNDTKQAIKQAIIDKGVDVSVSDTFRSYAEKISRISSGGDTTWAYHTGQSVAGDKVMLTKVNSLVTPDSAFCNGFRPTVILDGYVYGREGEQVNTSNPIAQKCQIVNGVIDSSNPTSISSISGWNAYYSTHYVSKGKYCMLQTVLATGFTNSNYCYLMSDTGRTQFSVSNRRVFHLENLSVSTIDSGSGTPSLFVYNQKSYFSKGNTTTSDSLAWEDGTPDCAYILHTSRNLSKYTLSTQTQEQMTETPTVITNASQSIPGKSILIQTKDYKYLLYAAGYIDVTLKNNTITINDYPPVILNAIGDRAVRQMQVFYDGYFCFQLDDGTTLMCKYTDSMADVEVKEIVEPIYVEGDDNVYIRTYSADRLYWWQFPATNYEVMPLANNPAGPYKAKEATSDYVAYTPSKDRFNSTVLSGFLTGETKDEDGRQMVEVKTALGVE